MASMPPSSLYQRTPDIFTWAAAQQVQHDHNYCSAPAAEDEQSTTIDHGTVNVNNIQWYATSLTSMNYSTQQTLSH